MQKGTVKRFLAVVMTLVMIVTGLPLAGFIGLDLLPVAKAKDYAVGSIVSFGGYPQSEVKDGATISALNAKVTKDDWKSYNYYSGNNTLGSARRGDWMEYCDIFVKGVKYRGVRFSAYRPAETYLTADVGNTMQKDNGYVVGTTYWFRWESLQWRVLDPDAGLVLSNMLIDAQPYTNTVYKVGKEYFCDAEGRTYANSYALSGIRDWLLNDFYNNAFSKEEQELTDKVVLNNSAIIADMPQYSSPATEDKIFLLSYADLSNPVYGIGSKNSLSVSADIGIGTDYAKSQGLVVVLGGSDWWIRSAGADSYSAGYVSWSGSAFADQADYTYRGVRPAFQFADGITESINPNGGTGIGDEPSDESEIVRCVEGILDAFTLANGENCLDKITVSDVEYLVRKDAVSAGKAEALQGKTVAIGLNENDVVLALYSVTNMEGVLQSCTGDGDFVSAVQFNNQNYTCLPDRLNKADMEVLVEENVIVKFYDDIVAAISFKKKDTAAIRFYEKTGFYALTDDKYVISASTFKPAQLSCEISYVDSDCRGDDLIWKSSDPEVFEIESSVARHGDTIDVVYGLPIAKKKGTIILTASLPDGASASIQVEVKNGFVYDYNEGCDPKNPDKTYKRVDLTTEQTIVLADLGLNRTGYVFNGWGLEADSQSGYPVGSEYQANEDDRLYALWLRDTDGDGFADTWEENGMDTDGDGQPDISLKAMGANPKVPDIFVQVDWMEIPAKSILDILTAKEKKSLKPSAAAMEMVYNAFQAHGINLHIDCGPDSIDYANKGKPWGGNGKGRAIEYQETFDSDDTNAYSGWISFANRNFDAPRRKAFHHCLFVDKYQYTENGQKKSNSSGLSAGIGAQYFIVAAGLIIDEGAKAVAGTFMHELGHNLGLWHGGDTNDNYNPNHISIMNYAFQMTGLRTTADTWYIDYSRFLLDPLDENSLDETKGVASKKQLEGIGLMTTWGKSDAARVYVDASGAIDFNNNGQADETSVRVNLDDSKDENNNDTFNAYKGFNDWAYLVDESGDSGLRSVYKGPTITSINKAQGAASGAGVSAADLRELTIEEAVRAGLLASPGTVNVDTKFDTYFADAADQKLFLNLTNFGATDLDVQYSFTGEAVKDGEYANAVHAKGTRGSIGKAAIQVPLADNLSPGSYEITIKLDGKDVQAIEKIITIEVAEMTTELKEGILDLNENDPENSEIISPDVLEQMKRIAKEPDDPNPPIHTHTPEIIPGRPATCTETGLTDGVVCSECGEILEPQGIIPMTQHTFGDAEIVQEPTCTEPGMQHTVCTVCGYAMAMPPIPALGHTEPDADGKCTRCGEQIAEPPIHTHTPEIIPGKAATCTETGLTDGEVCSDCGEIIKAQEEIPALGHDWEDDFTIDREPTETEPGEKSIHCTRCDARKDVTVIPATANPVNPVDREKALRDKMSEDFKDRLYDGAPLFRTEDSTWIDEDLIADEDISAIYHCEILDVDGDGEVELIAFAAELTEGDDGDSYKLFVYGADVLADGTVVSAYYMPPHCDSLSAIMEEKSFFCWAAVEDQYIAFVDYRGGFLEEDDDIIARDDYQYSLIRYVDGVFTEESTLDLYAGAKENEFCGCSTDGFAFEAEPESPEARNGFEKILSQLPSDLLFPFDRDGQAVGSLDDADVSMVVEDVDPDDFVDAMYQLTIQDCSPLLSTLRGDANLDGKVLANDARLVLRASAKLETLEGQAFVNCDLNGDGKLLAGEARKILRYSAKLETAL